MILVLLDNTSIYNLFELMRLQQEVLHKESINVHSNLIALLLLCRLVYGCGTDQDVDILHEYTDHR